MKEVFRIYEPDKTIKQGYIAILRAAMADLIEARWLTYQMLRRDFIAMYKQSFVGILWAIIFPLMSITVFIILNQAGLLSIGNINSPYVVYAMLGVCFWQLFANGLVASSNSLIKAGPMILKINFSKKSLVIASIGQSGISLIIQLVLTGVVFLWYKIPPNIGILWLPIAIVPLVLITIGLGLILSLLNGIIRDVGNIIPIVLTFLMFITPIYYGKPNTGFLAKVTEYNPLYYLISGPRDIVLRGNLPEWKGFILMAGVSVVIFLICLIIFHLTEKRIAEKI